MTDRDLARLAFGTVVSVDPVAATAVVRFDHLGITTRPPRVAQALAFGARSLALPRVGAFVCCLMDQSLNAGVVLCGVYTNATKPPRDPAEPLPVHVRFDDGGALEHDPTAGAFALSVVETGSITLSVGSSQIAITNERITLTAPFIDMVKA